MIDSNAKPGSAMILTLPWLGQKFVGWDNYRDLITIRWRWARSATSMIFVRRHDSHRSASRSRHALVLNESFRGRGWLSCIVLIPWAVPTWSRRKCGFIFNDRYGLSIISLYGDATQLYWAPLAEPGLALRRSWWRTFGKTQRVCRADHSRRTAGFPVSSTRRQHRRCERVAEVSSYTLRWSSPALLLALYFATIDALKGL